MESAAGEDESGIAGKEDAGKEDKKTRVKKTRVKKTRVIVQTVMTILRIQENVLSRK